MWEARINPQTPEPWDLYNPGKHSIAELCPWTLLFILKQGLTNLTGLALNSPCSSDRPWTYVRPASVSGVTGIARRTLPGLAEPLSFLSNYSVYFVCFFLVLSPHSGPSFSISIWSSWAMASRTVSKKAILWPRNEPQIFQSLYRIWRSVRNSFSLHREGFGSRHTILAMWCRHFLGQHPRGQASPYTLVMFSCLDITEKTFKAKMVAQRIRVVAMQAWRPVFKSPVHTCVHVAHTQNEGYHIPLSLLNCLLQPKWLLVHLHSPPDIFFLLF